MASTFSQILAGKDEIAVGLRAERERITGSKNGLNNSIANLDQMAASKGQLIADLNTMAAAAPGDVALQNAKAEMDKLVAEYTALKTVATAGRNAITV